MDFRGGLILASAITLVSGMIVFSVFKAMEAERKAPPAAEVQVLTVPIMGRQHVTAGEAHAAYSSNPPTSGFHYDPDTMARINKEQPVDEALVALLERGYIWISYNPATADPATVNTLESIPQEDPALPIVVTARPQDDSPVAVAGWGKVMKLQQFHGDPESEDRALHTFMRSLPSGAPEYQPSSSPSHG